MVDEAVRRLCTEAVRVLVILCADLKSLVSQDRKSVV